MNLRDLEYLIALETHRHFGKAALASFVSQPALSMQIKKLEDYLGLTLVERTNKSVLLTPAGLAIAERAKHILRTVEEVKEIAKLTKNPYAGELKIGIIPTLAPYLLPHIMPSLAASLPDLSCYLVEEQTALLIEKLKTGKLDAAFLACPVPQENFDHAILFEEAFFLAVPASHALAKRKIIKPQDIAGKHLLLLQEGHCMREQTLAWCHQIHAKETQGFQATSLETLRHMVMANVGLTLMPRLAHQLNDGLAYLPFAAPEPSRTLGLFWRASSAKKIVLNEIVKHVKKCLAKERRVKVVK